MSPACPVPAALNGTVLYFIYAIVFYLGFDLAVGPIINYDYVWFLLYGYYVCWLLYY